MKYLYMYRLTFQHFDYIEQTKIIEFGVEVDAPEPKAYEILKNYKKVKNPRYMFIGVEKALRWEDET